MSNLDVANEATWRVHGGTVAQVATQTIQFRASNGTTPIDISGFTWTGTLRVSPHSADLANGALTFDNGGANGNLVVTVPAAALTALGRKIGYYQVNRDGQTVLHGALIREV